MEKRRRCTWLGGKLCDSTAGRKTLTGIRVHRRLTTTVRTRKVRDASQKQQRSVTWTDRSSGAGSARNVVAATGSRPGFRLL